MAKQIGSGSTFTPLIDVSVHYQVVGDLDEALKDTGLSAHFIVWRLLLELDSAGAPFGITNHDFEISTGSEQVHFVGSYKVEKDNSDISFKISLIPGEPQDLANVGISADLRRRLWPPAA